jgi:hypothetical protein
MRRYIVLALLVCCTPFLSACIVSIESSSASTPTAVRSSFHPVGVTRETRIGISLLASTPTPLWMRFQGVWLRVYGIDRIEFVDEKSVKMRTRADSETVTMTYDLLDANQVSISHAGCISYSETITITYKLLNANRVKVSRPGYMPICLPTVRTFEYKFSSEDRLPQILTLTDTDTGEHLIYIRKEGMEIIAQPNTPQPLIPEPHPFIPQPAMPTTPAIPPARPGRSAPPSPLQSAMPTTSAIPTPTP